MHIREATLQDIPAIIPVWNELINYYYQQDRTFEPHRESDKTFTQMLEKGITSDDECVYIAEDDGRIIGYISGSILSYPPVFETERYAKVFTISVTKESRGRGAGHKLVEAFVGWVENHNITRIELRALKKNTRAVQFWQREGFIPFAEKLRIDQYGSGDQNAHVRDATPEDLEAITLLWKDFIQYHGRIDSFYTIRQGGADNFGAFLSSLITSDEAAVKVAEDDGNIMGYIAGHIEEIPDIFALDRMGFITDTYIVQEARGRGLATGLLRALFDWYNSISIQYIGMRVLVHNQPGQGFWRKMGFQDYLLELYRSI
jgi:ribosomal protein S18 acetylase RimI-like enzyme